MTLIVGLLADENHARLARTSAEDRLGGIEIQIAAVTLPDCGARSREEAARKAVRTKGPEELKEAAQKAPRTRSAGRS